MSDGAQTQSNTVCNDDAAKHGIQTGPTAPLVASPTPALAWTTVLAACVGIGAFLFVELYDIDMHWNLSIGRDILAQLRVPKQDYYTLAGQGNAYHDIHWLFQVIIASAHAVAGWVGVQLVMVGAWAVALGCAYRATRRWVGPELAAVLIFLVAMACTERFLPRPELVTLAMLPVFFLLLQEGRFVTRRHLVVLAVLQLIWTNGHGLLVIGPFMVGCYAAAELLSTLRSRRGGRDGATTLMTPRFVALGKALAVVTVATLINPYGIGSWSYAWLMVTQVSSGATELMRSIGELSPTFGTASRSGVAFWFYLVLLCLTGASFAAAVVRRRLSLDAGQVGRLLIVAGMMVASLTGRRNVVLFALVAAPALSELLPPLVFRAARVRTAAVVAAILAMLAYAWYPLSGTYYLNMRLAARTGLGLTPSFFPHGLPAFLDAIGFEGRVYNSSTIGGWYMWHGYPKRLPLVETRWTAYTDEDIARIISAGAGGADWRWVQEKYGIEALLFQHSAPDAQTLLPVIARLPGWRLVYYDYGGSFWMRADLPNLPPEVDLRWVGLPGPARVDDGIMLDTFLRHVGALEPRIDNLEKMLAFGYETERTLEMLGPLQIQAQRYEDAQNTWDALLSINPQHVVALNESAYLAAVRGDLATAESLLRRALAADPNNKDAAINLQRIQAQPTP